MTIAINLEYKPYVALYRRLSDALRKAILEGRLKLGEPMPSIRELSESLRISCVTVQKAYKDLKGQGFVVSRSGSGTYVSDDLPGDFGDCLPEFLTCHQSLTNFTETNLSEQGRTILAIGKKQSAEHVHLPALEYGGTPIELCPMTEWKALMLKHCDLRQEGQVAEMIEPMGIAPLRQAIAGYVLRRRSINCDEANICLFGSKQLRLDLIGRLLLNVGDLVAYEEPGYPENRHTLEALGATIVPVEVDREGISVEVLRCLPTPPKLIYVSPSHQDPLGYVMSIERRQELLDYAHAVGAFIIEDDFDNEFRYGKPVLPSLKALDRYDCVIYMASFWKVLYRSLRLSYVIFPNCLATVGALGKGYIERHLPLLDQLALVDFINAGYLEKHLQRTQRVLAVRRQRLILAITRYLRDKIEPLTEGGGTHILLTFKNGIQSSTIEQMAEQCQFSLMSTRAYYVTNKASLEYIVSFASVNNDTIDDTVKNFASGLNRSGNKQANALQDFAPGLPKPRYGENDHTAPFTQTFPVTPVGGSHVS